MRTAIQHCALASILLAGGCRLFSVSDQAVVQGHSPLHPAVPSPDSMALEIIWARFPLGDPDINDTMWSQIDETRVAPAAYRELVRSGFRVGLITGTPPDAIARVLGSDAYRPKDEPKESDGFTQTVDLTAEPKVQGRLMQLRRGRRAEIQASEVLDSVPLLVSHGRELGGRTYHDAQAIYALKIDPQPDQTVAVELTPELHYGQPRFRWTGGDEGILRQTSLRDREVFESMQMNVRLAPGEMLVLTCLPDSTNRLGHYFHTVDSDSGPLQKLVLVRPAQVPRSDTFESLATP